jgi:glutamyl-tRNA synthetase
MVEAFSLERISLGGPVFDMAKLSWLNGRYIREDHSPEALWERLREYFMSDERWAKIVPLVHERMDRLDEFMPQVAYFFSGDLDVEAAALKPKKKTLEELEPVFSSLVEKVDQLIEWNEESIETLLRGHCADTGWKPRDLFMPIRIAVTGRKATPGMWETLAVLGKERTRRRLREALKKIKAANRA